MEHVDLNHAPVEKVVFLAMVFLGLFMSFWPWCSTAARTSLKAGSDWLIGPGLSWILVMGWSFFWAWKARPYIDDILMYLWFGETTLYDSSSRLYGQFGFVVTKPTATQWAFGIGFALIWVFFANLRMRVHKEADMNGMYVEDWIRHRHTESEDTGEDLSHPQ